MRRAPVAVSLTVVAVVAACGGSTSVVATATTTAVATTSPTPTTNPPPTGEPPVDYDGFRAQPTACGAQAPPAATPMQFPSAEDQGISPDATVTARIETSCGVIVVLLDHVAALETVNSFVFLAEAGYFDGTAAHRVLPGFVIQAGDPTATGTGDPGYVLPDELPPQGFVYERGVLAMANAGPGTTGSQFFIMLGEAGLPPAYSAFGVVTEGDEVLDRIAALPLGDRFTGSGVETSVPLETVYLERVTVEVG
jgi:peptidyl-prolyl cis-trans isomerase B (cyclophilin B)